MAILKSTDNFRASKIASKFIYNFVQAIRHLKQMFFYFLISAKSRFHPKKFYNIDCSGQSNNHFYLPR